MAIGEPYRKLVTPCIQSHINYCHFHKYNYVLETTMQDTSRSIPWNKIKVLQRVLEQTNSEFLVWIDADAMITNNRIPIQDFIQCMGTKQMLISRGCFGGINSGVFIIRNTPWIKAYLQKVYDQTHLIRHCYWENEAISRLYRDEKDIQAHTHLIEQPFSYVMNAFMYNFQPASWVVHFLGHRTHILSALIRDYNPYANTQHDFDWTHTGVYYDKEMKTFINLPSQAEQNALLESTIQAIKSNCACPACVQFLKHFHIKIENKTVAFTGKAMGTVSFSIPKRIKP